MQILFIASYLIEALDDHEVSVHTHPKF